VVAVKGSRRDAGAAARRYSAIICARTRPAKSEKLKKSVVKANERNAARRRHRDGRGGHTPWQHACHGARGDILQMPAGSGRQFGQSHGIATMDASGAPPLG